MNEILGNARPVVLSLHGIRTRGKWQKDLTRVLNEAGFVHEPLDFGFFHALSLLNPRSRRKRVDWFLEQYTATIGGLKARPSIIAHSFGAYLVARTLQIYKQVKFDKVILCGSIVRRDFPWSKIIERNQVSQVLHDYGKLDVWAKLVEWVVSDAGQSGLHGFSDLANGRVVEQCHPEFRHSDYFFKLNYKGNWIPFLNGTHQAENIDLTPAPPSWRYRIAATLVAAFVIAGFSYAWRYFNADSPDPTVETPSAVILPVPAGFISTESSEVSPGKSEITPNSSQAKVNVKSDATCSLQVNGKGAGDLESGVSKVLVVESNQVNIVCASLQYPAISDSRSLAVTRERVGEVLLHLRGKIEAHEQLQKAKRAATSNVARTADVASRNTPAINSKQQDLASAGNTSRTERASSPPTVSASLVDERYDRCVEACESRLDSCKQEKKYAELAEEWSGKAAKYPQTSAWETYRRYDALAVREGEECTTQCEKKCPQAR